MDLIIILIIAILLSGLIIGLKHVFCVETKDYVYNVCIRLSDAVNENGLLDALFQKHARSAKLIHIKRLIPDNIQEFTYEIKVSSSDFPMELVSDLMGTKGVLSLHCFSAEADNM